MAHSEEQLNAPDGSALTWIFDHILRYPGTYELPLRTMYTLNCNPTRQPTPSTLPETAFARRPTSPKSSAAEDFRAQLTHQISRLPSQPCSLPPSFITSFLRRCFAPQLEEVDFPQALTGLDYLRDLETRRKKEIAAALQRLGVEPNDLQPNSEFSRKFPGVVAWFESINIKGRKVEALYTEIYLGLRRWTLLNEMLMEPLNKANCIAYLNTLFPPVTNATVTPTSHLTPQILRSQRDNYFRYINAIEANGKQVLDSVIARGAPEGESTGWPLVRDALDKYLRIANEIIDECAMVNGPASLDDGMGSTTRGHKSRKADSGISFGSLGDLSTTPSITSNNSSEDVSEKPLPPSPRGTQTRGGSTLERLARELRKVKLGDGGKAKGLRKMKSTNTLGRSETMASTDETSFFELDEHKRKRLFWAHSKQSSGSSSRFD